MQVVDLGLVFTRRAVQLEGLLDSVQQLLIPKGFRQKLHGPRLQCSDRHRNVSVRRDKNDRDWQADLGQLTLEIETAHLRQPHIENQATRLSGALFLQKLLAR